MVTPTGDVSDWPDYLNGVNRCWESTIVEESSGSLGLYFHLDAAASIIGPV
jgi:hypothetical protein